MSKIKSRYWNFINSEDYTDFYLQEYPVNPINSPVESFSEQGEYVGSSNLRKRLVERFKASESFKDLRFKASEREL